MFILFYFIVNNLAKFSLLVRRLQLSAPLFARETVLVFFGFPVPLVLPLPSGLLVVSFLVLGAFFLWL